MKHPAIRPGCPTAWGFVTLLLSFLQFLHFPHSHLMFRHQRGTGDFCNFCNSCMRIANQGGRVRHATPGRSGLPAAVRQPRRIVLPRRTVLRHRLALAQPEAKGRLLLSYTRKTFRHRRPGWRPHRRVSSHHIAKKLDRAACSAGREKNVQSCARTADIAPLLRHSGSSALRSFGAGAPGEVPEITRRSASLAIRSSRSGSVEEGICARSLRAISFIQTLDV
jgi:hypothetical protein